MGEGTDEGNPVARLIESQRTFYDLRAPDFGDEAVPDRGWRSVESVRAFSTGPVPDRRSSAGSGTQDCGAGARHVICDRFHSSP
jgi:hypothetical protein